MFFYVYHRARSEGPRTNGRQWRWFTTDSVGRSLDGRLSFPGVRLTRTHPGRHEKSSDPFPSLRSGTLRTRPGPTHTTSKTVSAPVRSAGAPSTTSPSDGARRTTGRLDTGTGPRRDTGELEPFSRRSTDKGGTHDTHRAEPPVRGDAGRSRG